MVGMQVSKFSARWGIWRGGGAIFEREGLGITRINVPCVCTTLGVCDVSFLSLKIATGQDAGS